ncbi:phosphatidate cytidylyltransferase [Microbacterium radiodurans]|uniref:Phosphatidate cytidylyltransferase n=1 Tax=Microbacterium radiodurans TaxID=661398 RepID=A0A5J5IS68_9MICO|nr:phosphatidate cytidylyltransferase [Microbacterium radiodurans]KAA9086881.1 phosphatidate cytidylyltransferase [Microbacterium radiodurans]
MSAPGDDATPGARERSRARGPGDASFHDQVRARRSEFEQQIVKARADFEQANERINARTGRNLILATLIGVGIGVVVIGSLVFAKWLFMIFAVGVVLLGVFELTRAFQAAGRRVDVVPQLVAGAAMLAGAFFLDAGGHWVIVFAAVVVVIVWRLLAQMAAGDGRRYGDVLSDVLTSGLVQLYVPFFGSLALILLREPQGEFWVLAMIAVVVGADTGAYAAGLAFGKHPMAPRISPKKTWEGFAGAAVLATLVAVGFALFLLHLPVWAGVIIGLAILGSATIGDLGESMIKRDLGIKDMSSWLPGHGGVLDRLDSILPSTVVALILFHVLSPLVVS